MAQPVPPVPPTAGPDELLDLAEKHLRLERNEEATLAGAAFDERYADSDLSALQRGRRADLHGVASANAGELGVAEIAWMSAIDLFAASGDDVRRQTTRCRIGMLMCRTGRIEVGLPIAQDATDYLVVHGPVDRMSAVHRRMAFVNMFSGRAEEAMACLDEAARFGPHSEDPMADAKLAADRAGVLAETGRVDEARTAAEHAREVCRTRGFDRGLASACWISGRAAEIVGDLPAALEAYDEALLTVVEEEFRRQVRRQRAGLLAGTNRAVEAIDDLVDEVASAVARGEAEIAFTARHHLVVGYLNVSRPLDAVGVAEEAIGSLVESFDPLVESFDPRSEVIRHLLAQAYRQLGQYDEAIEQLRLVSASGARREQPALVGEMAEQIGDILDKLDRDAMAARKFAEAAIAYGQAEMPLEATRATRRRATSRMWAGHLDEAIEALAEADLGALGLNAEDPAVTWERAMLACDGARILGQRGELDDAIIRGASAAGSFRLVGDVGAACYAATVHGEFLVRADRTGDAEPVLRGVLADTEDDQIRTRAANALAIALDRLDRSDEAMEIRATYGLGK